MALEDTWKGCTPDGEPPVVNTVYEVTCTRKGKFVGRPIEADETTWARLVILRGRANAILRENVREAGEQVSVRSSLCRMRPIKHEELANFKVVGLRDYPRHRCGIDHGSVGPLMLLAESDSHVLYRHAAGSSWVDRQTGKVPVKSGLWLTAKHSSGNVGDLLKGKLMEGGRLSADVIRHHRVAIDEAFGVGAAEVIAGCIGAYGRVMGTVIFGACDEVGVER